MTYTVSRYTQHHQDFPALAAAQGHILARTGARTIWDKEVEGWTIKSSLPPLVLIKISAEIRAGHLGPRPVCRYSWRSAEAAIRDSSYWSHNWISVRAFWVGAEAGVRLHFEKNGYRLGDIYAAFSHWAHKYEVSDIAEDWT